jgi:protein TonB
LKDLLADERLFYRRPGMGVVKRLGILVGTLLLASATVLLIPLSNALKRTPSERLELETVTTTSWKPPPPPPPKELPKPPPPSKPKKPVVAKSTPKPAAPRQQPQRRPVRLPLKLDFQAPKFEADFALSFSVDPSATDIPEVAEPAPTEPAPEPAPPPEKSTYDSSELDQNPVPISRPRPVFPYYARRRGIEGYVDVQFTVSAQGTVEDAEALAAKPAGVFDHEALRAIRRWRFKPGIRNGKPVAARLQIRIRFTLDR